ncbi:hypothetical protein HDU98_002770 [Podochytrium sp. JEL0797]|nr:hypothetical protein HDU98_002770 [Podochytrium sp. JEL0797]
MQPLESALVHAKNGAREDADGDFVSALASYRRALLLLDGILGRSDMERLGAGDAGSSSSEAVGGDRETRLRVIGLRSRYVVRCEELLAALPANARAVYSGQSYLHPLAPPEVDVDAAVPLSCLPGDARVLMRAESMYAAVFSAAIGAADDDAPTPDARCAAPTTLPAAAADAALPARLANTAARMRILANKLSSSSMGGFVTPRVAIPVEALQQPTGGRFVAIDQKIVALDSLYSSLAPLPTASAQTISDHATTAKDAIDYVLTTPNIQLMKKLAGEIVNPFEAQTEKVGMAKMIKNMFVTAGTGGAVVQTIPKGDKVADPTFYFDVAAKFLNTAAPMLDSWVVVLQQPQQQRQEEDVMMEIEEVVKFMDGVVVAFVTRDLERVLERFLRKVTAAALVS